MRLITAANKLNDIKHVRYENEGSPHGGVKVELSIDSPSEGGKLQGDQGRSETGRVAGVVRALVHHDFHQQPSPNRIRQNSIHPKKRAGFSKVT